MSTNESLSQLLEKHAEISHEIRDSEKKMCRSYSDNIPVKSETLLQYSRSVNNLDKQLQKTSNSIQEIRRAIRPKTTKPTKRSLRSARAVNNLIQKKSDKQISGGNKSKKHYIRNSKGNNRPSNKNVKRFFNNRSNRTKRRYR